MQKEKLDEFEIIKNIKNKFRVLSTEKNILGIGDDAAVIPKDAITSFLVTTDMLNEDVHFLRDKICAFDLGYKCLAVNLSDIAGMCGTPKYVFLSAALPTDIGATWINEFLDGFSKLSTDAGVLLLGGDTTRSERKISISVTVIGECENSKIKYRSSAKPGDKIFVTGMLGDSGAGFKCLLSNEPLTKWSHSLIKKHNKPIPHIKEGRWLGNFLAPQNCVHAMMDVSDGIASDLKRICEESNCGVEIYLEKLPISEELKLESKRLSFDALNMALIGGEDYCLLFTAEPAVCNKLTLEFQEKFKRPIYEIGKITDKGFIYLQNGKVTKPPPRGFEHF